MKSLKTLLKLSAMLLALVGLGALVASLVMAHPRLKGVAPTSPKPGELLNAPPSEVRLAFILAANETGLDVNQSFFWVVKEDSATVVALGKVDTVSPGRDVMVTKLPKLEPGVYLVKWVAVSVPDSGFAEGSYSFAVVK